jgi:hypothetical protein
VLAKATCGGFRHYAAPLRANIRETLTPFEKTEQGGRFDAMELRSEVIDAG